VKEIAVRIARIEAPNLIERLTTIQSLSLECLNLKARVGEEASWNGWSPIYNGGDHSGGAAGKANPATSQDRNTAIDEIGGILRHPGCLVDAYRSKRGLRASMPDGLNARPCLVEAVKTNSYATHGTNTGP
jgi:hypothetical protein